MATTIDGVVEEVDRPRLDDVVVVFRKVAEHDEDRLLSCLVDEDGFLVCIEGILQHGFIEPTILVQVTAGRIAFLGWRRQGRVGSLEDNVPLRWIWCRERVEFDDGNVAWQTIDIVDLIADELYTPCDVFVGPPASRFGLPIFREHVLQSLSSSRQGIVRCFE